MNADPDPLRASVDCELLKSQPPSNQFRILVIDDEPANRTILHRLLNAIGYEVIEAVNGASGLAQVVSQRPDLVIVDMEMPVLNGAETVAAVRQLPGRRLAELPIIAASGNPTIEMEESALEAGADIWMTKPFDFSHLQNSIAQLLQASRRPAISSSSTPPSPQATRAGKRSAKNPLKHKH